MVLSALEQERNKQNLRTWYKLDSACRQLRDAIHTIYEHAFSNEKLQEMAKSSNEIERAMATSPIMSIASYIQSIRPSLDIENIFDFYKYDSQATSPLDPFMTHPILSDMRLEDATSFKRKPKNKMTPFDKEVFSYHQRLKFLGGSWLDALISYNLYHKYPDMYSFNLAKLRDAILEKHRGSKTFLADKLNLTEKKYCDPESYIGALIIDRYAFEFDEISKWLDCFDDVYNEMGSLPSSELASSVPPTPTTLEATPEASSSDSPNEPKDVLEALLQGNKLNERLRYVTAPEKPPFTVQVKLGEYILGEGFAKTIKDADKKAAENALSNKELLKSFIGETTVTPSSNSGQNKVNTKLGVRRASDVFGNSLANQKGRPNSRTPFNTTRNNSLVSNTSRHGSVDSRIFGSHKNEFFKTDSKSSKQRAGSYRDETPTISSEGKPSKKAETKLGKVTPDTRSKLNMPPAAAKLEPIVTKPQNGKTKTPKGAKNNSTKQETPSSPIQHLDFAAIKKLQDLLLSVDLAAEYTIDESGDQFEATCTLAGTDFELSRGLGKTKRLAQIIAASNALTGSKLQNILD